MPRNQKKSSIIPYQEQKTIVLQNPALKRPSMMDTVKEGFSFGVGSSIARNVIDRVMGSSSVAPSVEPISEKKNHTLEFQQCMEDSAHNYALCKDYLQ
jgi:hypothetical protein